MKAKKSLELLACTVRYIHSQISGILRVVFFCVVKLKAGRSQEDSQPISVTFPFFTATPLARPFLSRNITYLPAYLRPWFNYNSGHVHHIGSWIFKVHSFVTP